MLSGDAAAARPTLGPAPDEARQLFTTLTAGHRHNHKQRRRAKSLTRALPVGRPSGGGGHPPPAEPPATPGVDLRWAAPRPDRRLPAPQPRFRFWLDELLWSQGRVAVELMETVLTEAGGLRTGGPTRQQERARRRQLLMGASTGSAAAGAASAGPCLGSQHMGAWEVLWTKSTYAIPAARSTRPGQLVSAIIGLNSLTMKKRLLLTLRESLGPDAAFAITPLSFALPEELDAWEEWLRRQQQGQGQGQGETDGDSRSSGGSSRGGDFGDSLWILKTGQDAGKGLSLLPADQAVRYARRQLQQRQLQQQQHADDGSHGGSDGGGGRRFQLQVAQRYIAEPFLIDGRKFHLRLWLLVTAHSPPRAYLHRRGLVLFSSELYDQKAADAATSTSFSAAASTSAAAEGLGGGAATAPFAPPASHVTNYARNANTLVWSMRQLADHLGPGRFGGLWRALCAAAAAALRAAAPSLAEAHAWLAPAVQEYGFQVLGVDFLLDQRLKPWLLEANSAPSIMVQHEYDEIRALVYEQKYGMLRDTWEVVRGRVCAWGSGELEGEGKGRAGMVLPAAAAGGVARWEAVHAGEYEPLMPYM